MSNRDWVRLVRPMLSEQWAIHKNYAYMRPVRWVMRGLLWEVSSARAPSRYLWRLRVPLVAPFDALDLSWSDRHGGGTAVYDPRDPATHGVLAEAIRLVESERAAGVLMPQELGASGNDTMEETRAYFLLLYGDTEGAIDVLRRLVKGEAEYEWEQEFLDRVQFMLSLLQGGERAAAIDQLEAWRRETLLAVGLNSEADTPPELA